MFSPCFSWISAAGRLHTRAAGVGLALLCPLLAAPPALAQSPSTTPWAASAADPGAATAPLVHPATLVAPPQLADLPSGRAWKDAHLAVGQFPRGHADIVRWEEQQGKAPAADAEGPGGRAVTPPSMGSASHGHQRHPHHHAMPGSTP